MSTPKLSIYSVVEDVSSFLSNTQIYDINDASYPYVKSLKDNKTITHYDNTLFEQIGEFYILKLVDVDSLRNLSELFSENLTSKIVPPLYSYQILINKTPVYTKEIKTQINSTVLISSKNILFGVSNGTTLWGPIEGEVRVWQ